MKEIQNPVFRNPLSQGIAPVWNEDCEILILGSITAVDGMRKGFLYASVKNQFWQLLDLSFGNDLTSENSFTYLKNLLQENYKNHISKNINQFEFENNKAQIRKKFEKLLLSKKIALCDVVKSCYFNNNSSLDQDIIKNNINYPLQSNKEQVAHIIQNANIKKVIVNSKFVENQFKKMKIDGDYEVRYVVSPSPRRGAIDKKVDDWKNAIREK